MILNLKFELEPPLMNIYHFVGGVYTNVYMFMNADPSFRLGMIHNI